jgi:antitoxin component YwqK of YwqJK toxin-antitoxin module
MKASIFSTLMLVSTLSFAQSTAQVNYESGELKSSYVQKHGLVEVTHFYQNGAVKEIGFFKNGIPEGKWLGFAENGQKTAELNYKNGKRHGEYRSWDLYANTYTEMNYADGKAMAANKWIKSGDFATIEK